MTRTGHRRIQTAVTIFDSVYDRAEKWRQELGMGRSEFYNEAVHMHCLSLARDYPDITDRIIRGNKGADNG